MNILTFCLQLQEASLGEEGSMDARKPNFLTKLNFYPSFNFTNNRTDDNAMQNINWKILKSQEYMKLT